MKAKSWIMIILFVLLASVVIISNSKSTDTVSKNRFGSDTTGVDTLTYGMRSMYTDGRWRMEDWNYRYAYNMSYSTDNITLYYYDNGVQIGKLILEPGTSICDYTDHDSVIVLFTNSADTLLYGGGTI